LPPELLQFQRSFAAALDGTAQGAIAVYRNTVFHGAVEALRANFPVVDQILGAEMFEHVAVDFVSTCPPRVPVLALYGAEFADWLTHQEWVGDLPYLPDVARVDRLHVESLLSADREPASPEEAMRACSGTSRSLLLHPAIRFSWLSTPAMSIWLAHQGPVPSRIAPEWKPEGALFARPSPFVIHAPRIGPAAHRILSGMRFGETLGTSMASATRLYPHEDCVAIFASLANLGAFIAPDSERS
jgi:hypothetical protein